MRCWGWDVKQMGICRSWSRRTPGLTHGAPGMGPVLTASLCCSLSPLPQQEARRVVAAHWVTGERWGTVQREPCAITRQPMAWCSGTCCVCIQHHWTSICGNHCEPGPIATIFKSVLQLDLSPLPTFSCPMLRWTPPANHHPKRMPITQICHLEVCNCKCLLYNLFQMQHSWPKQ